MRAWGANRLRPALVGLFCAAGDESWRIACGMPRAITLLFMSVFAAAASAIVTFCA